MVALLLFPHIPPTVSHRFGQALGHILNGRASTEETLFFIGGVVFIAVCIYVAWVYNSKDKKKD